MDKLKEIKTQFYEKFPNSNIKILNIGDKKYHFIVETNFGICQISKANLLNGSISSIQTSINKEEYFINQIKEEFPENLEKYKILEYINSSHVITQNKYGLCKVKSSNLLEGHLPSIETALNKTEYFINQAKELYNERYEYKKTIYIKNHKKVIITCMTHGDFEITPGNFLQSKSCKKCANLKISQYQLKNPVGWSKTNWWKASQKSKEFTGFKVYIIKLWNDDEEFYKIGRTFLDIKRRFINKKRMSYNYKVLQTFEFKELTEENAIKCYNLENELQRKNKENKYIPKIKFAGMQECFSKTTIQEV